MFGKKKKQMAEMIERLNKELEDSKSEKEALKGEVDTLRDTLSRSFDNVGSPDSTSGSSVSTTIMSMDADALTRNIMTRETEFLSVVKNMTSLFESAAADNRAVSENVKVLTEVYGKMSETVLSLSSEIQTLQKKLDAVVGLSFVSRAPYETYTKAPEQPAAASYERKSYEKYSAGDYAQPAKPVYEATPEEPSASAFTGSRPAAEQPKDSAPSAYAAEDVQSNAETDKTYESQTVVDSGDSDLYGLLFSDNVDTDAVSDSNTYNKDTSSPSEFEKIDDDVTFNSAMQGKAAVVEEESSNEEDTSASHWKPFDRNHSRKPGFEKETTRSGLTPEERRKLIERAMSRRR